MKGKFIKKVLALILVIVLAFSCAGGVVATGKGVNEKQAEAALLAASETSTTAWFLEKLASGAVGAVGGKAMNAVLGSIFGSSDSVDRFLTEINAVKEEIQNLRGELTEMSSLLIGKMNYGELKKDLDDFAVYINQFAGVYNDLCFMQELSKNDVELTEIFANDIYFGDDKNLWINGKTLYNATIELGNRLVLVLQGGYNIFGAYDKMEKYKNHWEHHGYADRKEFREKIIKIYSQLSTMCESACAIIRDTHSGNTAQERATREKAIARLNQLKTNAQMVKEMNERCAVIEHPDFRIYRDTNTGTNLYTFYTIVRDAKMTNIDFSIKLVEYYHPEYDEYFKTHVFLHAYSYGEDPIRYMSSMTNTDNPVLPPNLVFNYTYNLNNFTVEKRVTAYYNYHMFSYQPDVGDLTKIYNDYKSENPGKDITLYDIFFGKENGNFTNKTGRYGPMLGKGAWFATRVYFYEYVKLGETKWFGNFVTDTGEEKVQYQLAYFKDYKKEIDSNSGYVGRVLNTISWVSQNLFFSVTRWRGPELEQGSLMEPAYPEAQPDGLISGMESFYELPYDGNVTLSVPEDSGIKFQWYLRKGDGGEDSEIEGATSSTYTLPLLQSNMNGWKYYCKIIEDDDPDMIDYYMTTPVTLNLAGEGTKVHEVKTAGELEEAMDKITAGDWDGHTIKLTADITLNTPLFLYDHRATIDLNGHDLTISPAAGSEPNVNPTSSKPEIASVYLLRGKLSLTGEGRFNITPGEGTDYGIYAHNGVIMADNVTLANGNAAVYAAEGSTVEIKGNISATGKDVSAIECFTGSIVKVTGNVSAEGESSCGVYAESNNENNVKVEISGNLAVSGDNSKAAFLGGEWTFLRVVGNVSATGLGAAGIMAGGGNADSKCTAFVQGSITADTTGVMVWNLADVRVFGNVTVTGEGANAVHSTGGMVYVYGDITADGKNGTGIYAESWDLTDPATGAMVKADGKITAFTPLKLDGMAMNENEHENNSTYQGFLTFSDETNFVWTAEGSFVILTPQSPPTGDVSGIIHYSFLLLITAGIINIKYKNKRSISA